MPETLEFDADRHRALQNEFQRLHVLAAVVLLAQSQAGLTAAAQSQAGLTAAAQSQAGGSASSPRSNPPVAASAAAAAAATEGFRRRAEALLAVGSSAYCPPCHPTPYTPWSLELHGIL